MQQVNEGAMQPVQSEGKIVGNSPPNSGEYPFFFGHELLEEYREYQKSHFDLNVMITLFITGTLFFANRCNVLRHFNDGIYFRCSFICTFFSLILVSAIVTSYTAKAVLIDEKGIFVTAANMMMNTRTQTFFLDGSAIIGTMGIGLGLYARVVKGSCPANVTLWESQRCNPAASVSSVPLDHVMFLFLLPNFSQALIAGITFRATLVCWLIGTVAAIASLIHVNGMLEVWSMVAPLVIIVTTYKFEKLTRLIFCNNRRTTAAEREKQKYILLQQQAEHQLLLEKNKHEVEILAINAEEEYRLLEKEKAQMVALIGNIAHDLKTPLQSFLVDVESLKSDTDYCKYLDAPHDEANGPRSILSSLESTCCFMTMAINRSIDFAKSTGNIMLTPHMETFNISDDLSRAVSVIRHLKSSLEITVNPFPATMCLDIITDKHWFAENILCLLSNAVKYSSGGIVTVTVEHRLAFTETDTISGLPLSNVSSALPPEIGDSSNSTDSHSAAVPTDLSEAQAQHLTAGSTVVIFVEDAGIGISEDACKDLFQPFKQVQRLAGGTGLGLYSLSNRILALKGSRGVLPRKDGKQGSVFWFAVPYRPDPQYRSGLREDGVRSPSISSKSNTCTCTGDSSPASSEPSLSAGTVAHAISILSEKCSPKSRLHFLVVDDSPSILKVVGRALKCKKFDVDTADNGSTALDLLIKHFPSRKLDVVLMDLQMPIMDGIEAVRRYRKYEASQHSDMETKRSAKKEQCDSSPSSHASAPSPSLSPSKLFIIGMSANSDAATKQCAKDVGMDCFIAKPFTIAELLPLIAHIASSY